MDKKIKNMGENLSKEIEMLQKGKRWGKTQ
jgi:hypothetical protein